MSNIPQTRLKVDLYSDTQSRPSRAMREYMTDAEVGDEQRGEDPTTTHLQERVAELLGMEAAVFLPSGTMCNEIAYRVHCGTGDEIILDKTGHALHFEAGGPAALSGVMTRALDGERGIFTPEQVVDAIRPINHHQPLSRLLSVENTSNLGGGAVWPLGRVQDVCAIAHEHSLATHMDGARLPNAVIASGVSAREFAKTFDSAWIDLSKGLGAPVGGVLAGSAQFIDRAWRFKHQFGGAMRQSGMIAAAGVYALDHNFERLQEDHDNAKCLAAALAEIPGISIDVATIETNMVYFEVGQTGLSAARVSELLLERGVRIGAIGPTMMRAVTYLDVGLADVEFAARTLREILSNRVDAT